MPSITTLFWGLSSICRIRILNQFMHFKRAVKDGAQKFALCYLLSKHELTQFEENDFLWCRTPFQSNIRALWNNSNG